MSYISYPKNSFGFREQLTFIISQSNFGACNVILAFEAVDEMLTCGEWRYILFSSIFLVVLFGSSYSVPYQIKLELKMSQMPYVFLSLPVVNSWIFGRSKIDCRFDSHIFCYRFL